MRIFDEGVRTSRGQVLKGLLLEENADKSRTMLVEFVIIHLIYVHAKRRRRVITKKKSVPTGSAPTVADWYFKTLVKERSALREGTKELYREWKIYSGDESLFTVDGILYQQAYVIMGLTTYYWIFFRKEPEHIRKDGQAPLTCTHCGCCVYSHVPNILDTVKICIDKTEKNPICERSELFNVAVV